MVVDAKELLLETVVSMLKEDGDADKITSRSISARCGINQAMINYYYGSKDDLMKAAVSKIVNKSAENMYEIRKDMAPKDALYDFLEKISVTMITFEKYTKYYVPDLLLKDEIKIPMMIVPFIKDHFNGTKNDVECKLIAYQITSIFQLILYRMDSFSEFLGTDVRDKTTIDALIRSELDLMLPEVR